MISLCMIARDEEKCVGDCLRSVQGLVDEMIIVDTGSEDRTVSIAESFGAQVYHHPWENDFSKHRNQSIDYAKGDWILILDADEVLEAGSGRIIRDAIRNESVDSLSAVLVCYFGNRTRESWNTSIRLFRNGLGIHYEGFVHNDLVGCEKTMYCAAKIHNDGYDLDEQGVKKKFERTSTLLQKAIQDDPENFRHHHDLAVSYASLRFFQKAVEEGLTAIDLHEKKGASDPNILWTCFVVASAYFNLQMLDEAKTIANKAIKINPEHIDSYFVLASIYATEKNRDEFERVYQEATHLLEKYRKNPQLLGGLVISKMGEKWRLDFDYGVILIGEGLEKEAREWFVKAANQAPSPSLVYRLCSIACRENGCISLAEELVESGLVAGLDAYTYDFEKAQIKKASGDDETYLAILERLLQNSKTADPGLMAALGTEAIKIRRFKEAESLLTSAVDFSYNHPKLFTSLALACKYQGKLDEAVAWNLRAIEVDERDLDAMVNVGHLYFDKMDWDSARSFYEKALLIDNHQIDVSFRLSMLALMNEDVEGCIKYCHSLFNELNINHNMVIGNAADFAQVYKLIAETFLAAGKGRLHSEAMNMAITLGLP